MENNKKKLGATQKKVINDEPTNHKASLGARSNRKHARDKYDNDGDTSMTVRVGGEPKKLKCKKDSDSAPDNDASHAAADETHGTDDEQQHDIDKNRAKDKEGAISRFNTRVPRLEEMICGWCGEQATRKCSACSSINYCSQACQTEDFTVHERACDMFSKFVREYPRPSIEHRLVIYFPQTSRRPYLRWLNNDPSNAEEEVKKMVGKDARMCNSSINPRTHKVLEPGLIIYFDYEGVHVNESVEHVTECKLSFFVAGNIAVCSDSGDDTKEDANLEMDVVDVALVDATAETYRHFIDAMLFGKGDVLPAHPKI